MATIGSNIVKLIMSDLGKTIIFAGIILIVVGLIVSVMGKIPGIGKMPGDILVKRENFTFYAPIASSILISIILTLLLNIFMGRGK